MRVKEILRTATQAWSPATKHPAYLALGNCVYVCVCFHLSACACFIQNTSIMLKWSGLLHCLVSAGTAAQQLDASFNTSAALEIFEIDFADTSMDMKLRGTLPTSNRSVILETSTVFGISYSTAAIWCIIQHTIQNVSFSAFIWPKML